jgi:hypothetical protein
MLDTATRTLDAAYVTERLEEAGTASLCIPSTGYSTRMSNGGLDFIRDTIEAYGWTDEAVRPACPDSRVITRMDEAFAWLPMIPQNQFVMRRIVGARSLVHPTTEKHLFPWRRIGKTIGADYQAVQRWHAQGIALIVRQLLRQNYFIT